MKIAVVQFKAFDCGSFREHFQHLKDLALKAADTGADLVLFPECSIPGYYICPEYDRCVDLVRDGSFLSAFAEIAKERSVYVAMGYVREVGGRLRNSLAVFDRGGMQVALTDKSNMWHIDKYLFEPGTEYPVFDTEFGRIGLLICADARIPEIARILRLKGAQLILDSANLVSNAPEVSKLNNQQLQFIIASRAAENRVPMVLANKCGCEYGSVQFAGQSFAFDSSGNLIAQASVDREQIIVVDVDLSSEPLVPARRPCLYGNLTRPTSELPVSAIVESPYRLSDLRVYCSISKFDRSSSSDYAKKALEEIRRGRSLKSKLMFMPTICGFELCDRDLQALENALDSDELLVFGSFCGRWKGYLVRKGGAEVLRPSHACDGSGINVIGFGPLRLGMVFAEELYNCESTRCMMLEGADIAVWFDVRAKNIQTKILRTRCAENKMFAVANLSEGRSFASNPDGAVYCSTFDSGEMLVSFFIDCALSRNKTVVPGTEIVDGRIPSAYGCLLEE